MNPEIKDFFSHETMFTNSKNIENYPVLCNVKGFMVKLFANMGSIKKQSEIFLLGNSITEFSKSFAETRISPGTRRRERTVLYILREGLRTNCAPTRIRMDKLTVNWLELCRTDRKDEMNRQYLLRVVLQPSSLGFRCSLYSCVENTTELFMIFAPILDFQF